MSLAASFFVRRLVAAGRSLFELRPGRAQGWPDYFDNCDGIGPVARELFYKHERSGILLPFKGRPDPVSIEEKVGIEAHITAVEFGTTRRSRAFWRKQVASELIPADVVERYARGFSADEDGYIEKIAERMALHQRFWKVPYHYVSLLNGDVLRNNPITRYTFHGNGGNRLLVGVSLEGDYPGLEKSRRKNHSGLDEHVIETGRAGLRLAVAQSRDAGAPIEALYAHRQYSGGRVGDPGEGWWKEIGIPMATALHLERRVTFTHASGLQICREWDPLGLVDYRGRKLAA